jgi:aldehyde dehydrogenase (NAD+)
MGIMFNSGQDCTAGSRLYVQETVYDTFMSILVSKAKQHVVGDGFDEKSAGGPIVRVLLP